MDVTNHDRETDVYDRSADRYDRRGGDSEPGGTGDSRATMIGAAFAERERAHDAVHQLHDDGFRDTWIGIARSADANGYGGDEYASDASPGAGNPSALTGETRVESDNWFMRFFGEGDESLHDALVRHGVTEADARAAGAVRVDGAIVTVDGGNHPEMAAQIIAQNGGQLITRALGATGYGTSGSYGAAAGSADQPMSRTTSLIEDGLATGESDVAPRVAGEGVVSGATTYDDYGRYRAGVDVDESTRLQLREERLRVDKSPVSRGTATVGTDIVTEKHDIDVPVVREELFIERRPVNTGAAADAKPIGGNDVVRIPLSEEKVVVTKTPVVTEEVVVGTRQITDTQRVSVTTRKEQLRVDDGSQEVAASRASGGEVSR
jgi:uncharacterized protein (TIGR02271 family)